MKKHWLFIAAMICGLGGQEAQALMIDDFNFGTMNATANILTPTTHYIDNGPGILGGQREATVFYSAVDSTTPGNVGARVNFLSDGSLLHNQDAGVSGESVYVYDGTTDTNDPSLLFDVNATGLGGINLTQGGADRFIFDVLFADQSVHNILDVRVYSDATHYSDLLRSTTTPISSLTPLDFIFANFVLGNGAAGMANFSNAGAIMFLIDGTNDPALDIRLDSFRTNGSAQEPTIPEPASIALLGMGLSVLGVRKRYARKA